MSELARYEKELVRALDCPKPMRARFLKRLRDAAEEFRAENPDAPWDQVEEFLGDPKELAETMLERADHDALERYRRRKRNLKKVFSVGSITVIVVLVILCIFYRATRMEITYNYYPPVIESSGDIS